MPKSKSEVWEHFQELEKKQGSRYSFVRCKYCDEGGSSPIEGRIRTMKNHLKVCMVYLQVQAQKNTACSAPCEDDRLSSIIEAREAKKNEKYEDRPGHLISTIISA